MNHLVHRTVSLAACGIATVLCATPARSAPNDPSVVCEPAYVAYGKAIEAEKAGHLRQARDALMTCALSSCGELAPRCRERHKLLGLEMASIVPIVTDENGTTRVDVQVTIDGEPLASRLDGRGLPIEPGLHEFSFSMDGRVFHTEKTMIVEGQRNRVISVTRSSAAEPGAQTKVSEAKVAWTKTPPDKPAQDKAVPDKTARDEVSPHESAFVEAPGQRREYVGGWALPRSPLPYVLGVAGVAAIAGGALMTYWGNKDNSALENQCSPNCSSSSQDHIKTLYVASDISFGAGLAALGVTTWLFARSRSAEKAPAPSAGLTLFDVQPTRSGAYASFSGAF
jgi:hypothetical protein